MNVLVVGGGGREHAIIKALQQNAAITVIYALPGNGGIAADAQCFPIAATDLDGIADFTQSNQIDFAVVAPDDPLILGAVDRLHALGIPCFGPSKAAARIEGSKAFSKQLMVDNGIPTAAYQAFDQEAEATEYLKSCAYPCWIKASGPALGKGAVFAQDFASAFRIVREMLTDRVFGESGAQIVIEEDLQGPEVTVLAFTDGKTIVPMVSSMDHKRALDGDQGLNTGGMGTIAPSPFYTPQIANICMETIFKPTIQAMADMGCPFKGCLYFGLMLTPKGPYVIEYNCRFGDPETQVVLPLLETDLFDIMRAVEEERLDTIDIRFSKRAACCVVMASKGYPEAYERGLALNTSALEGMEDVTVYHAGTKLENGGYVSAGGRVLGITALGDTPALARERTYAAAALVDFPGGYCRKDIGLRALEAGTL